MQKRILAAVTLLAAVVGCSPPVARCGEEICTKEQRCSTEKKCVTDGKPIIVIDTPLDLAKLSTNNVEVKGIARDDDVPPTLELSINQSVWFPVKLDSDGGFVFQLPLPRLDSSSVVLAARAHDSKLQEARAQRTLFVDNTPPECSLTTDAVNGSTNSTTNLSVTLKATDGSLELANPRISTDGAVTFVTPSGTNGLYSYSWPLPIENGGAHELVFRIDDSSGNRCETKATVLVDNVKPTVAFTLPTPGSLLGVPFFAAGGKVTGLGDDGARLLKSVTVDFADTGGPRAATVTGNTWSVAFPTPVGDDFKVHLAKVVATDLADNTASATLTMTVDVKPPALAITAPSPGAKLNVTNFSITNNAPLAWTLTDGDPTLDLRLVLTDGGFVSPPVLPTSATDNPKTYQPVLRAADRAGNVSTASVTFTVDRVLPTVTAYTPANNTRMWPGIVTADFSEPMTSGIGVGLNPMVTGAWTTPSHFEVTGLQKDTVYVVQTGMTVTDLHGNPVVPINYRFHTETVVPAAGALLGTNYSYVLDAQADAEGTLNVLANVYITDTTQWLQFNPKTGNGTVVDTYASGYVGRLVAARTVQPDLSSRRLAGLWFNQGSDNVRYNINGGAVITTAGEGFIPFPAYPGEGSGLAEFGVILGGVYKRTGRTDVPTGLPNIDQLNPTDSRFEAVRFTDGGTQSVSFGCPAGVCTMTPPLGLGGSSQPGLPNAAASKSCSIHGYLNGATDMTTLFRYQPGCGGTGNPCASQINETNNFDQVIADPMNDGTFYGFNELSPGVYQVKKRVLSPTNCSGAITDVGAPLSLGVILFQPRIVVIRGVPGLVFADSAHLLKFVAP